MQKEKEEEEYRGKNVQMELGVLQRQRWGQIERDGSSLMEMFEIEWLTPCGWERKVKMKKKRKKEIDRDLSSSRKSTTASVTDKLNIYIHIYIYIYTYNDKNYREFIWIKK